MASANRDSYFIPLDHETEEKLKNLLRVLKDTIAEGDRLVDEVRKLPEMRGDIDKDRETLNKMHALSLRETEMEEHALNAALEGVKIKQNMLRQDGGGAVRRIPDFQGESLFIQMKEDRIAETMRSLNQELDEWIRKLRAPF